MKLAVIGGGISGLSAAWELRGDAEITVFEPGRLGGKLLTTELNGRPVDEGPDAMLTRVPDGLALCAELGIGDELVSPSATKAMLWAGGRLRVLPDGLMLGVPTRLASVARSGLLSPFGIARAGLDLILPRRKRPDSLTVGELVAGRFGREVATRLVDPLVGGIHAGSADDLSAVEVTPQLVAAAERSRSLLLALRSSPKAPSGPMFAAPRGGLGRLAEKLVESLVAAGVEFRSDRVMRVSPADRQVAVSSAEGEDRFDAAVVAVPARAAATLLPLGVLQPLERLPMASVSLVAAVLPDVGLPAGVSGFLVGRSESKLMTACSFASNKWPHWAAPGTAVVRISAGRYGDDRATEWDDETLIDRLLSELQDALATGITPSLVRVSRWPDAFPQYTLGHRDRVAAAEQGLARAMPLVALAGSSYRGSGIPACVASGRAAARSLLDRAAALAG